MWNRTSAWSFLIPSVATETNIPTHEPSSRAECGKWSACPSCSVTTWLSVVKCRVETKQERRQHLTVCEIWSGPATGGWSPVLDKSFGFCPSFLRSKIINNWWSPGASSPSGRRHLIFLMCFSWRQIKPQVVCVCLCVLVVFFWPQATKSHTHTQTHRHRHPVTDVIRVT